MNEARAAVIEESRAAPQRRRRAIRCAAGSGRSFTSAKLLQPARKTRRRTLHYLSFHRREFAH
ncbi:MAG TPA: hypothetical protein VFL36_22265 [Myxococcales bacterium]|nr:hypothetical protein [Myxococcales bacterium]